MYRAWFVIPLMVTSDYGMPMEYARPSPHQLQYNREQVAFQHCGKENVPHYETFSFRTPQRHYQTEPSKPSSIWNVNVDFSLYLHKIYQNMQVSTMTKTQKNLWRKLHPIIQTGKTVFIWYLRVTVRGRDVCSMHDDVTQEKGTLFITSHIIWRI